MIEQKKPVGALVLAGILLLSAFMMPMAPGVAPNSGNTSATPTATPVKGTVQQFEAGGMAKVPDTHIKQLSTRQDTETPPEPTEVRSSAGSQTMQVETTTVDGKPALLLRDDRTHDGRWVSVSTAWLQEVHGEVPATVTIAHEDGDTYTSQLQVEEDSAAFYVEEFSTNTVTFSGEVQINGNPAGDGAQYQYDIADLDSASNVSVNLTGKTNTENESVSGSTVKLNESRSVSIGGNLPVAGPSADSKPTITLSNGKAETPIDGVSGDGTGRYFVGAGVGNFKSEFRVGEVSSGDTLSSVTLDIAEAADQAGTVDIYVVDGEGPDTTYGEGVKVKSDWQPPNQTGETTITFDNPVTVDGSVATIEFVTTDTNGAWKVHTATDSDGTTSFTSQEGTETPTTTDDAADASAVLSADVNVTATASDGTEITATAPESGSNTAEFPFSSETTQIDLTGTGSVDYEIDYRERTETIDPGVELNGQTVSHTGTLADGQTVSLTIDESAIQQGTNTVNVSVGDGTLSADAPAPQVQLDYSHDASDRQSVTYAAEQWTSRYNVSKTYSSDRANATLTIPFDSSEIVTMRAVEYRINQTGGWSAMSTSNYALAGTTLEADLSAAYGGTIPAGSTVEVRANASKVQAINGSITVLEPTAVGDDLDTKIRVDSKSDGFRIATADGRIKYVRNASYTSDARWVADQQGQRLHLPNAVSGDTLRVRSIPVSANPQSNDVHLTVANTSATEPAFAVEPGQTAGNTVEYTFETATGGTTYALYSETDGVVRDSGTASSPLTLTDDDSQETLKFLIDDGGASTGDSSSSSVGGAIMATAENQGFEGFAPLIAVALALAGLVLASRNSDAVSDAGEGAADTIEGGLGGIPVVGPAVGRALSGLVQSGAQLVRAGLENPTIATALGAAIAFGAVQNGIVQLPAGSIPVILLGGFAIGSLFALRRIDSFSIQYWAGVNVVAVAGAAIVWSDTDIVEALVSSDVFPLLAVGGLAAVIWAVRAYQKDASTPDSTTEVVIETDGGEDR